MYGYVYMFSMTILHVEYAGGRMKYGILFIFRLFYEYSNLEHVHIHVIYRINQTEYEVRIVVATCQEYVNTYSTRRMTMRMVRVDHIESSSRV